MKNLSDLFGQLRGITVDETSHVDSPENTDVLTFNLGDNNYGIVCIGQAGVGSMPVKALEMLKHKGFEVVCCSRDALPTELGKVFDQMKINNADILMHEPITLKTVKVDEFPSYYDNKKARNKFQRKNKYRRGMY